MDVYIQIIKELITDAFDTTALILFVCTIPGVLLAITVHGRAHARSAVKHHVHIQQAERRCKWSPLRQMSVWGTVYFLLTGYGWSKPLKAEGRDKLPAVTALAGPCANLLWGLLLMAVNTVVIFADVQINLNTAVNAVAVFDYIELIIELAITANFTMAMFSILPWPGSDGYEFLKRLLFDGNSNRFFQFLEKYSLPIIIFIVSLDWVLDLFWSLGFLKYCVNLPVSFFYNLLVTGQEAILNFITNDGYSAYISSIS